MPTKKPKLPSISLYKRIAVSFIIVTVVLIIIISYFSWGKAIIKVEPKQSASKVEFFVDVGKRSDATEGLSNLIPAKILETTIEDTKTYPTTGKKKVEREEGDNVVGAITVINDSDQDYNFVVKTRFLSSDGILFRMKKAVVIPAKDNVDVEVYADDTKFTGVLNPTTFTIPGLRSSTQKIVYGKTTMPLMSGDAEIYFLTEDDVNTAIDALSAELKSQALSALQDQLKFRERMFNTGTQVEILYQKNTPDIGEVATEFKIALKVKVVALSLDESELQDEIKIKIREQLLAGIEMMNFDPTAVIYTMEKYDAQGQIITFKITYDGETMITKTNKIFDKENLIGLSAPEVKNYFANFDDIVSVDVSFSPFWVRRVPNLIDRVNIVLVK